MKTHNKKMGSRLAAIIIIIVVIAGGFVFSFVNGIKPVSSEKKEVVFVVEQGMTGEQIYNKLKDEGLIKSVFWAKFYGGKIGKYNYAAGQFKVSPNMGTVKILETLSDAKKGVVVNMVTLKDGYYAKDYAEAIASKTNLSANEILDKWNDKAYIRSLAGKYRFITDESMNSGKCLLEGYLMPDTYSFQKEATVEDITETILDEQEKFFKENEKQVESSSLGIHGIYTLASLIQAEAPNIEDMKKVSGVFYNRLEKGMKLGCSPTVKYALYDTYEQGGKDGWKKVEKSYGIDSPYNTYNIQGLPPGPIGNPGKDAILAAINPEKTDYLYFMADVKGDGKIHYAENFDQHNRNVNKYLNLD